MYCAHILFFASHRYSSGQYACRSNCRTGFHCTIGSFLWKNSERYRKFLSTVHILFLQVTASIVVSLYVHQTVDSGSMPRQDRFFVWILRVTESSIYTHASHVHKNKAQPPEIFLNKINHTQVSVIIILTICSVWLATHTMVQR